ncbi:MAG: LEA type 2 family protein [Spirochaetes bacterium]|nr:LEA type 2 family protein [Spirochaetota bacterium]
MDRIDRRTAALVAALVLLALSAGQAAAAGFPKPTAELRRFEVEALTLRDVTFLFELAVKNPYPLELKFDGMTIVFSVEGTKVFTAKSRGGFTVKAKGEKANTFTVKLAYADIIKVVKEYATKEWLATTIDATLVIPIPKMPGAPSDVTFTYKLSKKVPAIKPSVALLDFQVKPPTQEQITAALARAGRKVDSGKALGVIKNMLAGRKADPADVIDPAELDVPLTVTFTIEVRNEAKGPLGFDSLGYELFVNGESLVVGDSSSVVKQAGRTLITVSNTFSAKKLSKAVRALFADRSGTFGVIGKASIKLPDEIRKEPIPVSFDEQGNFSLK